MIETERLLLRPWQAVDREPFWAMGCDHEVMRYLSGLIRAESDAVVDRIAAIEADHGHCFWALERKVERDFTGFCGILPPSAPIFEHEIGWRLARHAWGQGYAREAAEASLYWAWTNLSEVPAIMAITTQANARSWGLMQRLGMSRQPDEDFDHPEVHEGNPFCPHILLRIHRPARGDSYAPRCYDRRDSW
jgi:RimJ/RimL family protein N-acetyltransferase